MWGDGSTDGSVFSAHAEVVLQALHIGLHILGILRARGGSSLVAYGFDCDVGYSPRTRR